MLDGARLGGQWFIFGVDVFLFTRLLLVVVVSARITWGALCFGDTPMFGCVFKILFMKIIAWEEE